MSTLALTRKDVAATVLTALAVLAFAATHQSWNVWLIGSSHRWAAVAILLLGKLTEWGVTTEELAKWAELDALLVRINGWIGTSLHINPQIADVFGLAILGTGVVIGAIGHVLGGRRR